MIFGPSPERKTYPEIDWGKSIDAEIRLRELGIREKELEIRRLEALARLEEARANARGAGSEAN